MLAYQPQVELATGHMGDAARIMVKGDGELPFGVGRRLRQDRLVLPEHEHHRERIRDEPLEHLHLRDVPLDVAHHLARRGERLVVASLLHPGVRDEVDVVRPVHQRVHARRAGALDEAAIGLGGGDVGLRGDVVVARLEEDVAGHVDEMTGAGGERRQAFG